MRNLICALGAAALVMTSGCVPKDGPGVEWPELVQCAPTDAVLDLVDDVADIFLAKSGDGIEATDGAKSLLGDLAREHGPDLVACVVGTLIQGWARPGAAQHPDRMAATLRARDFLSDEEITIERPEPDAGAAQ